MVRCSYTQAFNSLNDQSTFLLLFRNKKKTKKKFRTRFIRTRRKNISISTKNWRHLSGGGDGEEE